MALNSKHCIHTNPKSPKLDVQMSWWGMIGLHDERTTKLNAKCSTEQSDQNLIEQKVAAIAEAGFDGINGFLPLPEESAHWQSLLERYGLSFSVNAYPKTSADLAAFLAQAEQYGSVQHVNVQVMTPFLIDCKAIKLLQELTEVSRQAGIPTFIETHRGTVTQDLLRTISYIEAIDELRLTIDLSHYIIAGEMHTITDEAEALIQKVLTRTSSIHSRVSNGEQVQVSVGSEGEHVMLPHFERWWKSGMKQWRQSAADHDIFPFVVELGPPPYAITVDEYGERQHEISDRWEQSLLFLRKARRIWREVNQ